MSKQSSIPTNDSSGRVKPNSNQNTVYFKDLSKRFNDLKVNEKKKKRNSLTDFEAFDSTSQHGSRSRGAGGGIVVSRPSGSNHHAKALREIRSSLEPYAQASDITWESVHSLAQELNVDQTTAEQYARNCPSLEAAREKLIQVLKKKMRDERQMQLPQGNYNKQQYYSESQRGKLLLPGNAYHHMSPKDTRDTIDRGSPDGASYRAESPIYPGGHVTIDLNNGRHIQSADMVVPDYQQRTVYEDGIPQQHLRHDMSPPAYNSDYVISHQNRISSSPQSSLSDNVGSESGMKHVSMQRASSPFQSHMKHPDRVGVGQMQDNIGVSPGHVQQIVKRIQIPGSGSAWPLQVPAATMMNDEHKPIIKGVSVGSKLPHQPLVVKGNPQTGLGLSSMPAHPPPSYVVAQQFCNTQKHRGHGTTQAMGAYEVMPVNDGMESTPREQQWTDAINGVLMGNINYPAPPLSSSESLPSSSPRSSLSSNYQVLAAPCHASFMPLANPSILQPVNSKPVKKPQPMMADMPMNHEGVLSNHLPPHQMSIDGMNLDPSYDHSGLTYRAAMNLGSGRDPPPYRENPYSANPSDEVDSIQHSDHSSSVDSRMVVQDDSDMYMRKPSVVDNYLSSVSNNTNTNSNNYQAVPPNPLPKGTEAAVKAARVTAGNSKRHAGSYSAVSAAKQHKPGSVAGLQNTPPPTSEPPPSYEAEKKTIRTSPVPVRKKSAKGPKSNGLSSDSEEGSEEGSEGPTKTPWTKRVKMYTPAAYKFYMEQHIENVIKGCRSRASRRMQLEQEMTKMNLPPQDQDQMRTMLFQKESNYIRLKRGKINLSMFRIVKPLGVGAFGTVYLACKTSSGALYAIKTLRKKDVLKRNQVAHVKAERDILSEADNDWVVRLYYTFQDKHFLYFVMDYIPGGDMMSLLIKKGIFEEPLAQFYTAELTLALESVHKMGFIHRDIKPDNILIDRDGHIKLTDFGLCTGFRWTHDSKYYQREGQGHMRQDSMDFSNEWKYGGCALKTLDRRRMHDANRRVARSLVGTPNYIAPEVLLREGYTQLCDWWSVGVILYEMVVGQPPFNATSPEETQLKVINWKEMLYFPESARLSRHTKDIILRLCCDQSVRLGCTGVEEIKSHPYFRKVNWQDLRKMHAPHIPRIAHPEDTSNFDPPDTGFMLDPSRTGTLNSSNTLLRAGEHAFFEFTFRRFFDDDGRAYSNSHQYSNFEGHTVDEEESENAPYRSYNEQESSRSYNGQDEEEFRV